MTGSFRRASPSSWLPRVVAIALTLQAAGCVAKLEPLAIKEVEPGKPATLDPSLAAAAGNLNITRNGKSRIPYETGTDAGCVAAVVLLWVPLDILLGGHAMPPDCDHYLPRLVLVQLEARRAAVLQVQKYGDFVVQLPAGTYLVAQVIDDQSLVPMRFGFQIPKPDQTYDLGVISLEDGSVTSARVTAHSEDAFAQLMTQLPASGSWPRSTALFTQISTPSDSQSARVTFFDKKNLDAYLTAATLELKDKGMPLLSPAALAPPSAVRAASVPGAPVDVPFKIDLRTATAEGTAKLENGRLRGQSSYGGRTISLEGTLEHQKLSIEVYGAMLTSAEATGIGNYCSGTAALENAQGNVTLPLPIACGPGNYLDTIYLELPPAS